MATRFLVEFELRGGGGRAVVNELDGAEKGARRTAAAVSDLRRLLLQLGIGLSLRAIVRELIDAQIAADQINSKLKLLTGSSGAAAAELAMLGRESFRLGLNLQDVAQRYSTFALAASAAGISAKDVRNIFFGISEAAVAMGLSTEQSERAFVALQQMASKTKINMEELTGQLGEHVPRALPIMAAAIGKTVPELFKMSQQGQLLAADVLPKFGQALRDNFGQAATDAAGNLQQNINRMKSAWFQLSSAAAQTGGLLNETFRGIATGLKWLADRWHAFGAAVYTTLAQITRLVTVWAVSVIDKMRLVAHALAIVSPDALSKWDNVARGLDAAKRNVIDFGKNLAEVFDEKAADQIARQAGMVDALADSFGMATGAAAPLGNATKGLADEAKRLAEQIQGIISALQREAEAAEGLFAATKRGPAAVREFEVAQARLNAALQLAGTGAIPAVVRLAEDYAERAVRARHATDDWAAAQEKVNAAIAAIPGWGDAPLIPLSPEAQAQIQWLLETARSIRGAGTSSRDIYRQEQEAIKQVVRTFPKLAEDGQAALNASTQRFWSEQLSHWGDAFDFLAARFGGFFTYLSDLVRGLQQAQQFGQSVSGMASGMGASAGTAAGLGALGGTAAIFAIVYDIVDKAIKDSKTRRFGDEGEFGIRGGVEGATWRGSTGGIGGRAQEVANAIRDAVRQFEDALGVSVDELETIGLKIRNDGKRIQAYIGGEYIGVFNNIQDAITEALRIAVMSGKAKLGGLTDLMAQGLGQWTAPDLDELVRFLGQLREIGDLGLSAEASGVREAIRHLDGLWDALERLRVLTPAVQQGFDNLIVAEGRLWQNWIDSVTGREKTAAEILSDKRQELVIIGHELALRKAVIQQRIIEVQATIAAIRAGNMLIGGGGGSGLGGGSGGSSGGILGVAKAFSVAGQIVAQTTVTVATAGVFLSQAALDMIKALEAEAAALQGLLDSLPTLPDPSTIRIPGGRGSGAADLREEREAIDREIARFNLSDLGTQLADAQGWFDDMAERIREAFKGAEAVQRLTAAEDELARRRDEIAAAQRQASNEFLVRGTIWGGALLTGLRDIGGESQRLQQNNRELARSGILTTREMRELNRQIRDAAAAQRALLIQQTGTSFLADLYTFIGDEEKAAELRYNLTVAELRIRYEELRIASQIYGVVVEGWDEITRIINNLPSYEDWRRLNGPQEPAGGSASTPAGNAAILRERAAREAEEWAERVRDAMATLVSFERRGMDPFLAEILEIQEAFADLRAVLGNTARVQSAYARAIADTIRQFLEPAREALAGLALSETSPLEAGERLMEAERQLRNAQLAFRSGDLAQMADAARRAPDLVQQLLREAQAALPVGSQAFRSMFRWANEVLSEIVAWGNQMTGDSGPDTASLGPGPLGLVNFDPVIAQLQMGQDATTLELIAIRRATQRTADATESTASQLAHTQIAAGTG